MWPQKKPITRAGVRQLQSSLVLALWWALVGVDYKLVRTTVRTGSHIFPSQFTPVHIICAAGSHKFTYFFERDTHRSMFSVRTGLYKFSRRFGLHNFCVGSH
jgi:hypothetical protein